jgi:hypothetical protein
MIEGVCPRSGAKITRENIIKVRTIETKTKALQYLENRTSENQNSSSGAKPIYTNIAIKILHDVITDTRLWGNNETPDPQSQSNDGNSRPSIQQRNLLRHPDQSSKPTKQLNTPKSIPNGERKRKRNENIPLSDWLAK